jgi:hypothetical protein
MFEIYLQKPAAKIEKGSLYYTLLYKIVHLIQSEVLIQNEVLESSFE